MLGDTVSARPLSRQRGKLRLSFGVRPGRTVLEERYASAPFGAVRANYPDGSGTPEVQITNPSGGILGGDHLELEVSLAPGSSATLLTQAANKAYRGTESGQEAAFHVGEGAFLEYAPHHLIPYTASNYRQQTTFHLARDATLFTWDSFSAGRLARGERFAFERLQSRVEAWRNGAPEVVDGFDLSGGVREHFGGYSYLAAAYVCAPTDLGPLADILHEAFSGISGALASASAPSSGLCVVRVLADSAPVMYRALNACRELSRRFLGLTVPARAVL